MMSTEQHNAFSAAFSPERVWVDREVADHPQTVEIVGRLGGMPIEIVDDVRSLKRITNLAKAKREMILTRHRGCAFKTCQGMPNEQQSPPPTLPPQGGGGSQHICCRYYVLDLVSGCPMDCSYCILQHYLENNPRITVYVNVDDILAAVRDFLNANPGRGFRIGTGELGDSLAVDTVSGHATRLIPFFAAHNNALLELKTKTDFVDHLLDLPHNGRTVISWSVNTRGVIAREERFAPSLDRRLAAARRCVKAGYRVGFHFDPIIINRGSDEEFGEYIEVANAILSDIAPEHIAWISLGLLRFPHAMKATVERRFPATRIFSGELVPAGGKKRYARFLREGYYRPLWKRLTKKLPPEKVYLCMETPSVWNKLDPGIRDHDDLDHRLNEPVTGDTNNHFAAG